MTVIEIDNRPKTYTPTLAAVLKDLGVSNPANAAIFVNQLAFWLNTKSGHVTKDGEKFIYNTYSHWRQQFPCMSESQIGRMVRSLCGLGIVVKETFSSLKRRLVNSPVGFQEYNQTTWMTLCVTKLIELATWIGYQPESLLGANLQYCRLEDSQTQDANCETEFSTIYTKKTLSHPNGQSQEKEIPSTPSNTPNPPDKLVPNKPEASSNIFIEHKINQEGNTSAASSDIPKKRIKPNVGNDSQPVAGNGLLSGKLADPKGQESNRTEKYVWEIEIDVPYPAFLEWWANTHYKPQGGRFETGARSFAYSEFYNKPKKTTAVMYPDFLDYINTTVQACNQVQNDGQQAILPTCFIPKPEATEENTQALMGNVKALVERGAEILLPTKSTTPTSQSLPFAEAVGAAIIKVLPELKQAVDIESERRRFNYLRSQPEAQIELLNEWLLGSSSLLREEAAKLASFNKFKFERGENGDIVRVFNSNVSIESKEMPMSVSNIDWDAIVQQCEEMEKDAWDY